MKKQDIIDAIDARINSMKEPDYTVWRIGLTHDLATRKQQHEDEGRNTKHWKEWDANSLDDAEAIETDFINTKKMKGGTGGDLDARKNMYVYIF